MNEEATMTTTDAEFGVFCPGVLEVLSIGKGDLKLAVGDSDEDREQARELIREMLRKGYSIYVETDHGPIRVHDFNAYKMTYVIRDIAPAPVEEPAKPTKRRGRPPGSRTRRTEVPVAGSRATAVGATAGG